MFCWNARLSQNGKDTSILTELIVEKCHYQKKPYIYTNYRSIFIAGNKKTKLKEQKTDSKS